VAPRTKRKRLHHRAKDECRWLRKQEGSTLVAHGHMQGRTHTKRSEIRGQSSTITLPPHTAHMHWTKTLLQTIASLNCEGQALDVNHPVTRHGINRGICLSAPDSTGEDTQHICFLQSFSTRSHRTAWSGLAVSGMKTTLRLCGTSAHYSNPCVCVMYVRYVRIYCITAYGVYARAHHILIKFYAGGSLGGSSLYLSVHTSIASWRLAIAADVTIIVNQAITHWIVPSPTGALSNPIGHPFRGYSHNRSIRSIYPVSSSRS
jgi:hypothetical protein